MKIAIAGFQNSGKTTVFNALTGLDFLTTPYPSSMDEPNVGIVRVPDERLEHLATIYRPRKTTHSTIEYIDYQGLIRGDPGHNRKVFDLIQSADAMVEVIRVFADESIAHPDEGIDPKRDAADIETKFLFFDLELVEKRLTRMEESARKGQPVDERERDVLRRCRDALESEIMLRDVEFSAGEMDAIRHLQFLTRKPAMILLNISERDIGKVEVDNIVDAVAQRKNARKDDVVALSAKIEMEIAQLPHDEAIEFMDDLHIEEPALNRLIRLSYEKVGLISFLTVGSDEVRAWTIHQGTIALKAAGKIHSDIERGFIRAETVSYDDFVSAGSMAEVVKKGFVRLEGKAYEEKTLASMLLESAGKLRKHVNPELLDGWLEHLKGWAEIDSLCQSNFTADELLSNWPTWKKLLIGFNKSKNIGKRRASLVLLCKSVRQSDDRRLADLAFCNIDRVKSEKDKLITKAVSWLLRELIKNHRDQVEK